MAIKQLTPEQVRTMSLEEKDTWWLNNVYRGDMPQLTWRSAITGMLLGGVLSLTNLYIGAKTGWSLGVGITSVILSFAAFKLLSRLGLGREMTVLENNAMQSIATSAGYTNSALFTTLAGYTMVTGAIVPMYQATIWLMLLAVLGVLFAFPMKKRFINDEQLPFPEGQASGVVMDALHESDEREGIFKAKLLLGGGLLSAGIELLRDPKVMRALFAARSAPANYDDILYEGGLADRLKAWGFHPTIGGVELRELGVQFDTSLIFVATGGLMGFGTGVSMLVGGIVNYLILAPILIRQGVIPPSDGHYGYNQIVVWAVWGGVSCMTTASLVSFFSRPKLILDAVKGFSRRGQATKDVLAHIELPVRLSVIGVPLVAAVLVFLQHLWFGIPWWLGALAVPMVFVFSLIAVQSTGLTAITPTGALGQLTQLTCSVIAPGGVARNIMSAGIAAEVSSNTSNLLMDIKPGYMLGGKPRHQAIGHLLGALSGLALSMPIWYLVLVHGDVSVYGSDKMPVPAAISWKAVAELLVKGLAFLHPSARAAVLIGAAIGVLAEIVKLVTKGRVELSAVAFGLAFVVPFNSVWTMFLGSLIFWLLARRTARWQGRDTAGTTADGGGAAMPGESAGAPAAGARGDATAGAPADGRPWYALASENTETICAGVIAGGSLMGISLAVLGVLVLADVAELARFGKALMSTVAALPR